MSPETGAFWMFSSARYPGGPRNISFQWWGVNVCRHLFLGICVSATGSPWRQKPGEAKEIGGKGKEKKSGGCTEAGLPSPATQHRPRCPALPQPLSREVPNKPWEGQRRAGGRGEREVTELENLG